jgi:dethiobiotin synthetase/adenosylmethionine--8-amino-7-oxononanoate aminotransferase
LIVFPFHVIRSGVHSPTPSGTTQVESYRPLFLPTILIGDSKLGGISSTISAFESLLLRGYIVDAVLLFRDELYRNWEYLTRYFAEQGVLVAAIEPPPPQSSDPQENRVITDKYYNAVTGDTAGDILNHLDDCHVRRSEELDSMPRRTLDTIWWPFVQHRLVASEQDVTVVDSAVSDFFSVYNPHRSSSPQSRSLLEPQFDGSASWWTQAIGHAHPSLTLAAARAAGRYGHVIFPQATHLPVLKLAERLVRDGPGKGWASRAFFSDDGSTGMEIALKMALRAFCIRECTDLDTSTKKQLGVLGLKGSYHGDTIGAMDACEEGVFTCEWHSAKGYWFEPPTISIQRGEVLVYLPPAIAARMQSTASTVKADSLSWVYDVPHRLKTSLATVYRTYIEQTLSNLRKLGEPKLAALVLEPLVMGAGGMIFVDPLFQRVMVDVVRGPTDSPPSKWSGLPVIFDEVFVGLYRLGMQSSIPLLGVTPDISVYAKILTGGLVPLAVTLASNSIFEAFLSENKTDALLHGHSYTAHPVGCEVANEALNLVESLASGGAWKDAKNMWSQSYHRAHAQVWSFWHPEFVNELSCMTCVAEVMTLGTVLAFKLRDEGSGGE